MRLRDEHNPHGFVYTNGNIRGGKYTQMTKTVLTIAILCNQIADFEPEVRLARNRNAKK